LALLTIYLVRKPLYLLKQILIKQYKLNKFKIKLSVVNQQLFLAVSNVSSTLLSDIPAEMFIDDHYNNMTLGTQSK